MPTITGRAFVGGVFRADVRVNLREAPHLSAAVIGKVQAGDEFTVRSVVSGDAFENNSTWFEVERGYVWAAAFTRVDDAAAPASASAVAHAPMPHIPWIVDLYHEDTIDDLQAAAKAGLRGIIHKATTGASGSDARYAARRRDAAQLELLWGATHWGTAAPVDRQIDNFLHHAAPDDDMLLALDFEVTPGDDMTVDQAVAFLDGVSRRTGRAPVLYAGGKLRGLLNGRPNPALQRYRLWLAEYGVLAPRPLPGWPRCWLWQYSDGKTYATNQYPHHVPGVPGNARGELDCNYFDGSEAALRSEWSGR